MLTGQLQQILNLDQLDDSSLVRRRRGATCHVDIKRDDGLTLLLGDRTLHLPASLEPVVRYLLGRAEFRIEELGDHLDAGSRLVLVRRLIKEGLLEQDLGG